MKRFISCFIFGALLYSCNNGSDKFTPNGNGVSEKYREQIRSDTFCSPGREVLNTSDIQLLKACHIVLSDSLNDELAGLYGAAKLPSQYNFDNQFSNLNFSYNKNLIHLRLLFLVNSRARRIEADTFFLKKDTLFVKEKGEALIDSSRTNGLKFEEFYYIFSVKDTSRIRTVRHL